MTPEQMGQMVLFATATARVKAAADANAETTLTGEESGALIFGIQFLRQHGPECKVQP